MANYMAQGSVSVRRLRNGDNFFITLETTQPLYQGVDPDSGAVAELVEHTFIGGWIKAALGLLAIGVCAAAFGKAKKS